MSFEYYIRIDDLHEGAIVKTRLRAALIASDILVSEAPDQIAVKGKSPENSWDFDIRVIFSSPVLMKSAHLTRA